jgi:hypothetical protein
LPLRIPEAWNRGNPDCESPAEGDMIYSKLDPGLRGLNFKQKKKAATMMPLLKHIHIRFIIFPSVIFLLLSFLALALDQHFNGISQTCAICKAKVNWNGTEQSISTITIFYSLLTFYYSFDYLMDSRTSFFATLNNKAPPA